LDPKLVERYIQIRRLAEQGVGGEASNARAIQQRMEQAHPGIQAAADARVRAGAQASSGPRPHAQAHSPGDRAAPYMNWQWDWQTMAASAASWASELFSQVLTKDQARQRAAALVYTHRVLQSGNMQWAVKMPLPEFYRSVEGLSPEQKAELAQQIGDLMAQRIYATLVEGG